MHDWASRCISGILILASWPAEAAPPDLSSAQKAAIELMSRMTDEERQEVLQRVNTKNAAATAVRAQATKPAASKKQQRAPTLEPNELPDVSETKLGSIPILNRSNSNSIYKSCSGWIALLRQDWKDVGLASCPQPVDKATGAQATVTDDRVKNNVNWSLHGMAALLYNTGTGPFYSSTGVYVTADRSLNSSQSLAKTNVDTVGFGGVYETGFANGGFPYYANYYRVRGGAVEDNVKDTTIANVTGEWLPVYDDGHIYIHRPFNPIDGLPLIVRFDPELLVQYAAVSGRGQVLAFNNRTEALRIGPQLTMNLYPGTDPFFRHFFGSVSYHWAYETYSGHGLSWFQATLTYNLDDDGYFGLTGSYTSGRDEDTGVKTNLYKVALTGKI